MYYLGDCTLSCPLPVVLHSRPASRIIGLPRVQNFVSNKCCMDDFQLTIAIPVVKETPKKVANTVFLVSTVYIRKRIPRHQDRLSASVSRPRTKIPLIPLADSKARTGVNSRGDVCCTRNELLLHTLLQHKHHPTMCLQRTAYRIWRSRRQGEGLSKSSRTAGSD